MPKPRNAREASIRNTYLSRLSRYLQEIYSDDLPDSILEDKRQRLDGFIDAALISESLTTAVVQALIDDEHYSAYELTLKERGVSQQQFRDAGKYHDFKLFETPSYTRRKPHRAGKFRNRTSG